MKRVKDWLWVGVALAALSVLLASLVSSFLPVLIVGVALYGVYALMFQRRI